MSRRAPFLVPVDGSEPGLRALALGAELARSFEAPLHVVTVLDLGQLEFYDGMYMGLKQVQAWQEKIKETVLEEALSQVPSDLTVAYSAVLQGPVVPTLLQVIEDQHAGHVIMGRTGKGAVARLLEGSVSRRMAQVCPVPVTLVG